MSDSVKKLCILAQTGDPAAAKELVELFYERLYAWLRRLTGSEEDAADLTQITFSRVWKALPRFQEKSSFSTWLHGIGHHVYLDWRRKQRPTDSLSDEWWRTASSGGPTPSETAADRDLSVRLFVLVEALAEEVRHTIHLHYYEGLSIAETAEALGVATSTVKYRLRQGVQRIQQELRESETSPML